MAFYSSFVITIRGMVQTALTVHPLPFLKNQFKPLPAFVPPMLENLKSAIFPEELFSLVTEGTRANLMVGHQILSNRPLSLLSVIKTIHS